MFFCNLFVLLFTLCRLIQSFIQLGISLLDNHKTHNSLRLCTVLLLVETKAIVRFQTWNSLRISE